ncbi:MAG: hypothetical protein U5R14_13640 [Gemmatimonadota bacterium]|nr:hypothetical protein [Gemmatimonadota bacterium]
MSDQDEVRPYHAKDVGSGKETADTLAEVLQHAAQRDEASRAKQKRRSQSKWMLPLGINLGVLAVYLLIAPPAWVVLNPIEPPPPEEQLLGLRTAMYVTASQIEAYRAENGSLPEQLEDTGVNTGNGVEYFVRGGGDYQLVGSVGEETVVYDSTESLADWAAELNLGARVRGG